MSISFHDLADVGQDRLKALVYGEPGTGKTTLATSIAAKVPTAYLDLRGEQGTASIPRALQPNIRLIRPTSVEQLHDIFWSLQNGEVTMSNGKPVGAVVVESVSALQAMLVRYEKGEDEAGPRKLDRANRGKKKDLRQVYGEVVDSMRDIMTFWYALADATKDHPLHVIMTSQAKRHEIRERTSDPNELGALIDVFIGPDVSPGSVNATLAPPNFVLYTAVREWAPEDDFTAEPEQRYTVRLGPHELIRTKVHGDYADRAKWPDVVGLGPKKQRLTLPALCQMFQIPIR